MGGNDEKERPCKTAIPVGEAQSFDSTEENARDGLPTTIGILRREILTVGGEMGILVRPHTKKETIQKLKVMGKSLLALAKKLEKEPRGARSEIESVTVEIRYEEDYLRGLQCKTTNAMLSTSV